MANTYKNIVITPNIGNTSDPRVQFSGGNTTANTDINLYVYPTTNGTLSFEGSAGQLFSITNDLTGSIFAVNDVSGIPSIEVFANGEIDIAPFGGNVVVGSTAEFILSSGTGLHANGSFGTAGQILTSNGSSVYWSSSAFTTVPENAQTVTSYTLALLDAGKMVTLTNASAITLTIPTEVTIPFPLNTRIDIGQGGAGQVTVGGAGVTIRSVSSRLKLTSQYSGATLWKKGTNEWWLIGDITT
jgi:hypothetical protein